MFLTATAPNPLVVDYVAKVTGGNFHLSWTTWAACMLLPGLVCIALMPLVIYLMSPPEIKKTPDAVQFAKGELARMGRLHPKEKVMLGTFGLLLLLWANVPAMVFGKAFTLDPTVVAFLGLFVLIITGTIDWDDVLSEKSAWDTLIWFGALVMLADQLNKVGVIGWFSDLKKNAIVASGMGWRRGGAAGAGVRVLALCVCQHHGARQRDDAGLPDRRRAADPGRLRGAVHADHDRRFDRDDGADPFRHRHLADHLRQRLRVDGQMVASRLRDVRVAAAGLRRRRHAVVEGAGLLVSPGPDAGA
jgi:hypothetical protein